MGLVYADIELINAAEKVMAKRHFIGDDEVNSIPPLPQASRLWQHEVKENHKARALR